MEFKNWFLKQISISLTVILLLAALLLLIGRDISLKTANIKQQRQDFSLRSQALNSLAFLRSEAERSKNILKAIQDLLPQSDQLINFPKSLEGLAKNNQLSFGFSFNSETPAEENKPAINAFTLNLSGQYNNFLNFLKAVERSQYFVAFDFLDLNKKGADFEIIMKGRVFSQ